MYYATGRVVGPLPTCRTTDVWHAEGKRGGLPPTGWLWGGPVLPLGGPGQPDFYREASLF